MPSTYGKYASGCRALAASQLDPSRRPAPVFAWGTGAPAMRGQPRGTDSPVSKRLNSCACFVALRLQVQVCFCGMIHR
jgi:hypothetical protein